MSSRQLRKLQKQRELEATNDPPKDSADDSSEDEDTSPAPAVKPRASLFAALGGDGDDQAEDDEPEDNEPQKSQEEASPQPAQPLKKSKKKKKKKAKAKAAAAGMGEEEEEAGEDEIDKAMKELNITSQRRDGDEDDGDVGSSQTHRINELLSINTYHLKAINEMRNLFGRDVIESANAEEEAESNRRRGGGRAAAQRQVDLETFLRGPPNQKRLPEVSLRRNVFIQGREHWPRATAGGLMMKTLGPTGDGGVEYVYEHDVEYDAVQAFFFRCVGIGDPMRIVYMLQKVPYHVSALLQVSAVAKQDQNMALSAELCERALFTFGRVATSAFRQDLEQGRARLEFRRPENRQLWLAGYHYLKSLVRKGTYRTALEWAKVLFALDHKDPYAMRQFIHFLAIRAHQAQWFVDFIEELEKISDNRDTAYLRQTVVLAKLQLNDAAGAKKELEAGMKRVPWLYCALYQELGLDAPPSIWGINAESDSRQFWTKLYIYQTKELWNNTSASSLLQQVAKSLEKVDTSSLPVDDPPPDLGATRLAYLEGQTSIIGFAPRALLDMQPNYEFDPLPPPEEENIFTGHGCRLPWLERDDHGAQAVEHQMAAQLQNLLERRQAQQGGQAQGPGAFFPEEDDEQLEALLEQHPDVRQEMDETGAPRNAPGIFDTVMRLIRGDIARSEARAEGEDEDFESAEEGPLPGAWPDDDRQGNA